MAVSAVYSVTTTKVQIYEDYGGHVNHPNQLRIKNAAASAATVFIGGPELTATNGYEVPAGITVSMHFEDGQKLYAITAAGTATVHLLSGESNPLGQAGESDNSSPVIGTDYSGIPIIWSVGD